MKKYYLDVITSRGNDFDNDMFVFSSVDAIQEFRKRLSILSMLDHMGNVLDMNKEEQFDLLTSLGFSTDDIENYTAEDLITENYGVMLFDEGYLIADSRTFRCVYGEK